MTPPSSRPTSRTGAVARLGFADSARAVRLLEDPALAGLVDPMDDVFSDGLVRALSDTADPDQALLGLVRLFEAVHREQSTSERRGQDRPDLSPGALHALARSPGQARDRLLAVLGASSALGDHLVRHPDHWVALTEPEPRLPGDLYDDLVGAVGADPRDPRPVATADPDGGVVGATDALRVAYRRRLLALAGRDLASATPADVVDRVSLELADLAAAALEAALAVARAKEPDHGAGCRIAVIGMGKCGGRELNYVSDVDVVYVVEPDEGVDEDAALATGTRLATALAAACQASTAEGTLWPVDAALRPEGKSGPLVRTLESHRAYYGRWASTWEFQALLKARCVAGDRELGERYGEQVASLSWEAAGRENFVPDVQAMRRRVEDNVPSREADRQLKLGPGGLRDVEFSVQLLQLVHGRTEERLRTGNTLEAVEQLSTYGFVGRDDAAALDRAYRDLRVLEHRIQLTRLRRTHLMPTTAVDLERLARAARYDGVAGLERRLRDTRTLVRSLHERLFYRPVMAAAARLSAEETRLTTAGGGRPAGGARLPRPVRGDASPRGAHRGGQPAGGDPAPAAAGAARLVRRGCRPRRRPARLPPRQRRPRDDALVPQAPARLRRRRRADGARGVVRPVRGRAAGTDPRGGAVARRRRRARRAGSRTARRRGRLRPPAAQLGGRGRARRCGRCGRGRCCGAPSPTWPAWRRSTRSGGG